MLKRSPCAANISGDNRHKGRVQQIHKRVFNLAYVFVIVHRNPIADIGEIWMNGDK